MERDPVSENRSLEYGQWVEEKNAENPIAILKRLLLDSTASPPRI
jgi:hypothetical protein